MRIHLAACAALVGCSSFGTTPDGPDAAVVGGPDGSVSDAATSGDGGAPPANLVAFVTTTGYADTLTVASADTKCGLDAQGRLPGKFVAWYPATDTPAASRLVDSKGAPVDGPWYRPDGKRVAGSRAALLDTAKTPLENPIAITPLGSSTSAGVWTGTLADGGIGTLCPTATATPTTGTASDKDAQFTDQHHFTPKCGDVLRLYCFQVER